MARGMALKKSPQHMNGQAVCVLCVLTMHMHTLCGVCCVCLVATVPCEHCVAVWWVDEEEEVCCAVLCGEVWGGCVGCKPLAFSARYGDDT